jgi:hypothetical protein
MHLRRLVVLVFACATSAGAQAPPKIATPRSIGMLEIPRLSRERIVLRRRPMADSPIVASIASLDALEIKELETERSGAIVFGRERGWNLLRTGAGVAGWLAPSDAGEFHSLESLLRRDLTYLTDAWDGRVAAAPGAATRTRLPSDPRKRMIGYIVSVPARAPQASQPQDNWILVFQRPDPFAPVVARFQSPRYDHVLRGTSGRTPAEIVVFDRRPGWFQVALQRDNWETEPKVWIQNATVWQFHELASEAERERLTREAWGREYQDVRVVQTREVAGILWLDVEMLSHTGCSSSEPPTVKARGWIPAHATSGEPTVWFSARGC